MNEVRLTLETFLLLCKVLTDTEKEKERLRRIVVMQNRALERLTNELQRRRIDKASEFWLSDA